MTVDIKVEKVPSIILEIDFNLQINTWKSSFIYSYIKNIDTITFFNLRSFYI